MAMSAHFVKHISFPFYEWCHGSDRYKNLRKNMRSFERSQWFTPEQLKAIQWERLKKLLHHAYQHVPYYQEQFKILGAVPDDIRSFDDFTRFPRLTKQTLQERLDDLVASNMPRAELIKGVTSGSTGRPTYYYRDCAGDRLRIAAGRRLNQMAGYDFGLKLFFFWRQSPYIVGTDTVTPVVERDMTRLSPLVKIKKALHDRFGVENPSLLVDPTLLSEPEMDALYKRLRKFRPEIIISYVSALYLFARYLDAQSLGGVRPRSIIVSSETLHPHQRDLLEKVFGCPVYNRYGLGETGFIAIECPVRQGLHVNQEILHTEYVPSIDNTLQLIITDLINYGMPLLRYETGDTGIPLDDPCPCGRGLSRIGDLCGRVIDLLPTQLGGYVNGQLFATFHWINGIKQYQVVQEKIDFFKIRIVRTPAFQEKSLDPMLNTIREKFGNGTSIKIEYLESIPFTKGGKYKLVVSELKGGRT